MKWIFAALMTVILALPGNAQMSTAAEVKPILQLTKGNWIAVREFDEQDLLYFTHLEVFRCGLAQIRYAINDSKPLVWQTEPCEGDATFTGSSADRLPYTGFPLGLVQMVRIELTFDDGTVEIEDFERAAIMIN